jgi:aminoglycoside phosphotransferase (APT) family kinase protein
MAELVSPSPGESFAGGVNQVTRLGETIVRPTGLHGEATRAVLDHLAHKEFAGTPRVLSIDHDAGTETLTFLAGETTDYPLAAAFRTDQALISAARFLRRLHDSVADFDFAAFESWFLPPRHPVEVVCHGDFAPYNCVLRDGEVAGVFDFDTAHPGPRLWDLGYLAYRWVPLTSPDNPDGFGTTSDHARRLALVADAYGTANAVDVLDHAHDRLHAMVQNIGQFAAAGHEAFQRHIAEGHDEIYLRDASYIASNHEALLLPVIGVEDL